MSEPFLERLSRFTPAAGGLNRDELLFAAGRNSARPNRTWKALASTLAVTQALSLALFLPQTGRRALAPSVADGAAPAPPRRGSGIAPPPFKMQRHGPSAPGFAELDRERRPAGDFTLIEPGPPLRAFRLAGSPLLD